jgi:hypothetical protein
MIWTGEAGQLATTYVLALVPGGLWYSTAIGLEAQGVTPGLATVLATAVTAAWLAVTLTPTVRRMVVRCIFPDERPGREWDPDGGHDLEALAARVRAVMSI